MKPEIVAIVGQTASGKSALAVEIAKKYNGEVVSADSRQVYKKLNIGTGKITKKEMQGVPHHLLDVANPKNRFTVDLYKKMADKIIADILNRGKLPILCGGTGFYLDAVIKNITLPDVPVNNILRKKLSKKTPAQLFSILKKVDPKRAQVIGEHNGVRLIRAIEIVKALGKVPPIESAPKYETLTIGIETNKKILAEKIHTRLLSRIKQGMIREAKKLHADGLTWKRMDDLGLEYRYLAQHLQGKITKQEMIEQLNREILQYARRQAQWFSKNDKIKWLKRNDKKVYKLISSFLK